jgi:DNA polymerase-3 subunit delta'
VFVIERAETMNDQAANRMLKTLEEPPPFAHLILLTDRLANVMETIASRCQPVRFEAPTAAELAERLRSRVPEDVAVAAARLARGDGDRALALAVGEGPALRAAAEGFARSALHGRLETQPWGPLLEQARGRGELAGKDVEARIAGEADYLPDKDARRAKKEGETVARRAARRAQADTIDHALELAALWFRDVACIATSPELVLNADRLDELRADAEVLTGQPARLHEAMSICDEARTVLVRNPGEELLLETLASRLERLLRA